jgi:hypothetical protein
VLLDWARTAVGVNRKRIKKETTKKKRFMINNIN